MPAKIRSLAVATLVGIAMSLGVGKTSAQTLNLTFDWSQLANPLYSGTNLYVTFQANSGAMTVNSDVYTFDTGTATGPDGAKITTRSYSFSDLNSSSISISSVTSMIGYISYGSSVGFNSAAAAPSEFTTPTRYTNFELTYNNGAGQADITQIVQFGGGLQQTLYTSASGGTPVAYTGNNFGNVQTTSGDIMRQLAAAANNNYASGAVQTTGTGGTGDYIRVVGPSKFPNSNSNNPYPTFNPYLQSLSEGSGNGTLSVARLENLQPGAAPGGAGSNGLIYTGTAGGVFTSGSTYLANYYFDSYVQPVVGGSGTTYQVVLSGSITMAAPSGTILKTYSDLTITLAADSGTNLYMTNNLYAQVYGVPGTDVTFTGTGWASMNTDFSSGTATMQPIVTGDFTQGILAGLVGNTTIVSGTAVGDMTSREWWNDSLLAYTGTNSQFENQFGDIIFANTGGTNSSTISGSFNTAGIYGNPYDDRWGSPLINFTNDTTNTLQLSLIPDGDLAVLPEPGSLALLGMAAALGVVYLVRRRAKIPVPVPVERG